MTDVSPDHRQLVVIAQTRGVATTPNATTPNVYLTDLSGNLLNTLWTDLVADRKNVRALWSPDGRRIAWCHYFTTDSMGTAIRYGVGLAQLDAADRWTTQLQKEEETLTTPLAWSPDGRYLLCGRIEPNDSTLVPATLLLMDDQLRPAGKLFELKATTWGSRSRDFGRLADWAVIPEDALPQALHRSEPLP